MQASSRSLRYIFSSTQPRLHRPPLPSNARGKHERRAENERRLCGSEREERRKILRIRGGVPPCQFPTLLGDTHPFFFGAFFSLLLTLPSLCPSVLAASYPPPPPALSLSPSLEGVNTPASSACRSDGRCSFFFSIYISPTPLFSFTPVSRMGGKFKGGWTERGRRKGLIVDEGGGGAFALSK